MRAKEQRRAVFGRRERFSSRLLSGRYLAWGSHAARTALNLYAGTHYNVWIADGMMMPDSVLMTGNRTTPLPCTLTLTPNPSDGHLTLSYTLPAHAQVATLVVYDAWGTEVARQPVSSKALQATLQLTLRAGFYHATLVADGVTVDKERLLMEPR